MKVILHIGPHKTGTTSIQAFLHKNSDILRKHGFHYPKTHEGLQNHHDLAIGLRNTSSFWATAKRIRRILRESEAEGYHTCIFSSEIFVEHEIPIHLFRRIFKADQYLVIAYIRNPEGQISASYAELLKESSVRRTSRIDEPPVPYDSSYCSVFPKWFPHFAPGEMVLAPFDAAQWPKENLLLDFCQTIGLDSRIQTELEDVQGLHRNRRLPACLQEVLRRSNALLGLPREIHLAWCDELEKLASEHPEIFRERGTPLPQKMARKSREVLAETLPLYRPYFRRGFDKRFLLAPLDKPPSTPDATRSARKSESLFFDKIAPEHVLKALDARVGDDRKAVLLCDGYGDIDEILGDPRIGMLLDVRKESPVALDSLGADDVVIYACTQDDLGLPFIAHLHKTGRKYYPVRRAQPGGYVFTNTTAREVLKVEFEFQKREGFDKWDFGHRDFTTLIQALDLTKNLPGCYLEAGCYRGSSAGAVLRYLATTRRPMQAFLLDVFEGFQYVESETSADAVWHGTHVTDGFETVRSRLMAYRAGFPDLKISVEKNNIISDALPARAVELGIAVANLDVDLHEAVYAGLHKLAPHMVQHGILVVEDPGHTPLLIGAKFALEKFLGEDVGKQFIPIVMDSGQSFLIRK